LERAIEQEAPGSGFLPALVVNVEVKKVVGTNGGLTGQGSVVGRVRQLLVDFEATGDAGDPLAASRVGLALDRGVAEQDFYQIVDRLRRLREVLPELADVEAGPLVLPTWERVARRRVNGDGEGLQCPRRSRRETGR
jgi:hypothetical protein